MELEELRQRLLLRSKSADIPPVAHPVQIPDVALSQAASKVKWEPTLSPEVTARMSNPAKTETSAAKHENGNASRVENARDDKQPASELPKNAAKDAALSVASSESKSPPTEPVAASAMPMSMLANTVSQLSEPTEAFREHFDNLSRLLEPIDTATQSTEQALKRIAGLYDNLSSLANNFQSVKAFAEQVKTLSASFEPMKGLNAQLEQVTQALYTNVKAVGTALAPVKTFQAKVSQLASALDSIDKLEGQIAGLAEAFRPASEKPAPPQSATNPDIPAQVAQAA